ncbi:hypothetical protein P389DRAFT_176806 [Cystobasidium minutum MCA 4210]|uniref:uncharacterized protein n=1 Tax=Cystobasidium minutum MCA 4210 TaxID=1397322 RepID=UPI0034CEDD8C|eukprot:jgi/Rhomi1/176806/fgenesh1_pg.1_\
MSVKEALPVEILDLLQFYSPSSNCPSQPLPFQRLAIFGAAAPSTPLHLALSYAQGRRGATTRKAIDNVEDSGPVKKHVLLLCTSRNKFYEGLVLENEEYLAINGGDPAVARILEDNVEMKFIDSMAKWTFFCSAVSTDSYRYTNASEARVLNLKKVPDLVIVCGLSLFLAESRNTGAGIGTYASLVATTISAFAADTRLVFFDDPPDEHISLPLLPLQHRSKLRQLDKEKRGTTSSPEKGGGGASSVLPEPRSMELLRVMDYFCDGIGEIAPEGGTEDVLWYRLTIRQGSADVAHYSAGGAWDDLDKRYAVHKGEDELGYSGRERWSVRFT